MKYFLTLLMFLIIPPSAHSNDYFKALELFNLRKIEQSLEYFKKVANDEKMKKEVMQCLI